MSTTALRAAMRSLNGRFRTTRPQWRRPVVEMLERRTLLSWNFTGTLPVPVWGDDVSISSVAADAQGDLYIAGGFSGNLSLGSSSSFPTTLSTGSLGEGSFIAKYLPSGTLNWDQAFLPDANGAVGVAAIAVNPTDGSVYAVGQADGDVNFDPGTTNLD